MENCKVSKPACMTPDASFKWVSDPPPTKEEMARWAHFIRRDLCECDSAHPADCKCVTSIDRAKEGRLMAMVDANAAFFHAPLPYSDDAVPLMVLYKCVKSCELVLVTEKANKFMRETQQLFKQGMDSFIDSINVEDDDDDEDNSE